MLRKVLFAVFLVGTLVASASDAQQNSWARYQPRTLQALIDAHRDSVRQLDFLFSANSFPSQAKLVYLGKARPVSGKRLELLRRWEKMAKRSVSVVELFRTEVLFREGKIEHWLPVQTPLVAALTKDVKPGESINAYVIFMGGVKIENRWEWMFAINRFDEESEPATSRFPQSE